MNAIILAAGSGTRMKDEKPKVLQEILGKPFLSYVMDLCKNSGFEYVVPIIGYKKDEVINKLHLTKYVVQDVQLGTGHAVKSARDLLSNKNGLTLVIAGDQPLITTESIENLVTAHLTEKNILTMLTAINPNPFGYGRIIKKNDRLIGMVEESDATDEEKLINEVNISVYLFDNHYLWKHIDEIENNNSKNEYYINDLVEIFEKNKYKMNTVPVLTFEESIGINDKIGLESATKLLQQRINSRHMFNGVTLIDSNNTYIGPDVTIGSGTVIYPGCVIEGKTKIGKNSIVQSSYIRDSIILDNVSIGPFAHIRYNSYIGNNVRLGNFVEVKKSNLADGVKSAHLTYLGDSEIGERTNIGCGVITVNYDGVNKFKTKIGKESFIGSNVNLVAPISIGNRVKVAAGSTVTEDVTDDSLAIARSYQTNKEGYYKK